MSIVKVNYTYGILTNGVVPTTSPWYRGAVNIGERNKTQQKALTSLWAGKSAEDIGTSTEFIIKLLKCSEYWPDYVMRYDPNNTYDNQLAGTPGSAPLTYTELLKWANSSIIPPSHEYSACSSAVERIVSAFYSVLTSKDGYI